MKLYYDLCKTTAPHRYSGLLQVNILRSSKHLTFISKEECITLN